MTEIDPAKIAATLDAAVHIRGAAPCLYAALEPIGGLATAVEDNAPNIWSESVDLRRSEKAVVMEVLAAAVASLASAAIEIQVDDVADAAAPAVAQALEASGEMGDRLREAAEALRSRERRTDS